MYFILISHTGTCVCFVSEPTRKNCDVTRALIGDDFVWTNI